MCSVALALPDGSMPMAQGSCEGEIIPEERGTQGFGYDSIFYFPELGRTMGELDLDEKNRISHRARAVKNIIPAIEEYLKFKVGWVVPIVILSPCQEPSRISVTTYFGATNAYSR